MSDTDRYIIVSTHDSLCPVAGGGAERTLKCALEFKRRGYKVLIIAPTDGVGELNGIKVHWLHPPKKQYSQIFSALKFNVRILRKFLQFVRRTDMFFVHNTIAAVSLPFLKLFFPFRFVLDITDIHAEYLPIGKRNIIEKILTPFLLKVEYGIIRSADEIIAVTEAMKRLLISKGIPENKIHVVYDGVEINKIDSAKEAFSPVNIIHLGLVDRQHGVHHIVYAASEVVKLYPKATFYIIGGGRELERVRQLAKQLGVLDNFVFTGHLECRNARQFLRKAHIGIIPRENNLPNNIVTTLKLYEYWASATAVVSSRLDGITEIARDGKDVLFFESADAKDLASKIILLLNSPEKIIAMQKEGLNTVKKYTWDELIPGIVNKAVGV